MRIPLIRRPEDTTPIALWEWVFLPVVFAALCLGALLGVFVQIVFGLSWCKRRWQHLRAMRRQGRFIPWQRLQPRLRAGEGTLVIEQRDLYPSRVWWTPENVFEIASPGIPPEEELDFSCD